MDKTIEKILPNATNDLIRLTQIGDTKLWVDYDKEADVLYVNFDRPQKADNAIQKEGVITRFKNKRMVGFTILSASKFSSH